MLSVLINSFITLYIAANHLCLCNEKIIKYILIMSVLIFYFLWKQEFQFKMGYLLRKNIETYNIEKNEILDFLPDGVLIYKE